MGAGLVGVGGELDAARLAPAADLHLGLDHDRVAERSAASTASRTVSAGAPGDTGMPYRAKSCLPWYSKRSTRFAPCPRSVRHPAQRNRGRSSPSMTNRARRRRDSPDWTFSGVTPYTGARWLPRVTIPGCSSSRPRWSCSPACSLPPCCSWPRAAAGARASTSRSRPAPPRTSSGCCRRAGRTTCPTRSAAAAASCSPSRTARSSPCRRCSRAPRTAGCSGRTR